ncbi:unnamed protein product [Rotaria magnacalcarata]|uniref:Uncharacterized protein n=1 Tax=Rotaria magnacalcarata TaxID=392030 RepID=A0A816LNT7_9BILA|nr:unnamed protein product [Rotaria magnacalcarata]CAF3865668.1 unnamed protein product [Rotaria magnacalcarata]
MHILFRLLLVFSFTIIVVHSQGARGGGGGSRGGGGYRGGSRGGTGCQGADCSKAGIIAGSVIGGVLGLIGIIVLTIFCCRRYRAQHADSNDTFISKSSTNERYRNYQTYEEDYFNNGDWLSRYHQYGRWNGPHRMSLVFDRNTNRVTGNGSDNVGKFIIDGTFSLENQRVAMVKTYELGTGDPKENFGHTVDLQMTWNSKNGQFEGKWCVNANHYRGEDNFEMKYADISKTPFEKRID